MESHQQDIPLWEAFKEGNKEAFRELFRKYYPILFLNGTKITPNHALLEDCIHDLFTELWFSSSKTQINSVKAYLLRSLQYKLLKQLNKKTWITVEGDLNEDVRFELSHESLLIDQQLQQNNAQKVKNALQQLTNRQREIVYLKFYQNLRYEEIGEVMHINYQAARNLLYQAIKALRKNMELPLLLFVLVKIAQSFSQLF